VAMLPDGTTHYFLNLIDENQFLRSYPLANSEKKSFAGFAISATEGNPGKKQARTESVPKNGNLDLNRPFDRWDTDKSGFLSLEEYKTGQTDGISLEQRFKNFDRDGDGKVTRDEFVNRVTNAPRKKKTK
jgi:hypothetical protein